MPARRSSVIGAAAGAGVGVLIAVVLVLTGALSRPATADPEAPGHFLRAWQRYRMATFTLEADVTRTRADGAELTTTRREVQQPPDRVIIEHGSASGRLGGREVQCSLDPAGAQVCGAQGPELPPWEDEVTEELSIMRGYVGGETRIYDVVEEDRCFLLTLTRPIIDPPYGSAATFCFDEATGALTIAERHLEGDVIERADATSLAPTVNPRDLTVSLDEADAPQVEAPATTQPSTSTTLSAAQQLAVELRALNDDAFFARAIAVTDSAEARAIVNEGIRRMEAGELSINDPRWLDADGRPLAVAPPLVRALLEEGYGPPLPGL